MVRLAPLVVAVGDIAVAAPAASDDSVMASASSAGENSSEPD